MATGSDCPDLSLSLDEWCGGRDRLIRPARVEDADAIAQIYRPFVQGTAVSFETQSPSKEEMGSRIQTGLEEFPWLVWEASGSVLGYASACQHRTRSAYRWCADTAVYVSPSARRAGVGRDLYTALLSTLRDMGYFRALAGISLPNDASIALHESLGYEPIGVYRNAGFKLGRWHDVGWWGLQLQPPHDNPNEPKKYSAM